MDRSQVRARIIEVGQIVKKALIERGVGAEDKKRLDRHRAGVAKTRTSPFWSEERGFKYIDDVEDHLRRLFQCLDLLNLPEGSLVFEIGPGNCYFLFMCRELRCCGVQGIDWKQNEGTVNRKGVLLPYHELKQYAFRLFRAHFGLEDAVKHQIVAAHQPMEFGGRYDAIVATRAMFNHGWAPEEYRFWLNDCYQHLRLEGKLMVHFNKVAPDALADLPFLRPLHPPPGNEKLSIISRDELGRVINSERRIPDG
jgi:hypothetical protein